MGGNYKRVSENLEQFFERLGLLLLPSGAHSLFDELGKALIS